MNKLMLMCLVFVIACSKSGDSGKVTETPTVQEASITAEINQEAPILLVMGNISYNKTLDGIVVIKQKYEDNLVPSGLVNNKLVFEEGSHEGLSIISQSGCTSIKKTTGSCTLKIRANASGLAEGTLLEGSILVHSDASLELDTRIYVQSTVGANNSTEPQSLVSAIPTSLPYGSLSIDDRSKDLIVTFKAIDSIKDSDSHEVIIPSPFVLQTESADRCSNKTIARGMMCTVKVRIDPSQITSNGLVSGNITFAGLSVPVSATITGNVEESAILAWVYNGSEISALDLGTLLASNVPTKFNLILKNNGTISSSQINVSLEGSGFNIINRCVEKTLLPQAQCSLEIRPESSVGTKSMTVLVDGQSSLSVPLDLVVIDQVVPVITYQAVDTTASCSSLNLQSCDGTQSISKTYLCEKYIDGAKDNFYISNQSDCSLPDMTALSCLSPAGTSSVSISGGDLSYTCTAGQSLVEVTPSVSCDSNYEQSGITCLAVSYEAVYSQMYNECSASVACDGVGSQEAPISSCQKLLAGSPVSGGQLSDCSSLSQSTSQSCNSPSGTLVSSILGGSLNYNCASGETTSGLTPTVLCDEGFSPNQLDLLCDESVAVPYSPRMGENGSGASGTIYTTARQSDGKIILVGAFTTYNGSFNYSRIIRLNTDGSPDLSFNGGTGPNNYIRKIKLMPNGKIVVGGQFSTYSGVSRDYIAVLNNDGSLDTSFAPSSLGAGNTLTDIGVQSTGKIIASFNFKNQAGSAITKFLVRFNTDGTLDSSFSSGVGTNTYINSFYVNADDSIIIGGGFATFNGIARSKIAKLTADGELSSVFNVNNGLANDTVYAVAPDIDGKIIVAGLFTTINGVTKNKIARFNTDGTLDSTFNTSSGPNDLVNNINVQEDGKMIIIGSFTTVDGISRKNIAKLNQDGTLDLDLDDVGTKLSVAPRESLSYSDKILLIGDFTTFDSVSRNKILVLNNDGTLDDTIFKVYSGSNQAVYSVVPLSDGKTLIGGLFTSYNGISANRIGRLNADGSWDSSFNIGTGFNQTVQAMTVQSDGKIIVVGNFTTYNGVAANRVARLNADGTLDTAFSIGVGSGPNAVVNSVGIQTDGKIIIAGGFTTVVGASKVRIARLNTDGSIDHSFYISAGFNSTVNKIIVQEDNKILAGGVFSTYEGVTASKFIKLNEDGTRDTSFVTGTGFSNTVTSFAVQEDGKIIFGGDFLTYNSSTAVRLARLNSDGTIDSSFSSGTGATSTIASLAIQGDGKVVITGLFVAYNGTTINRLARVNTDGTLDSSFVIGTGLSSNGSFIEVQSDGKIIITGLFTMYNNIGFDRIVRVNPDGSLE